MKKRGRVTLLMDIYSIVNLEPCDSVTQMTVVDFFRKNGRFDIKRTGFWSLFLSQNPVTEMRQ